VTNEIGSEVGMVALRWYAKRAKLLAAFQRFAYQYSELQWAVDKNWEELARYLGQRIAQYDFWENTEMCGPIRYNGRGLQRFLKEGRSLLPSYRRVASKITRGSTGLLSAG
jgi:hypothetical protein